VATAFVNLRRDVRAPLSCAPDGFFDFIPAFLGREP
jgi:hypothetical protein